MRASLEALIPKPLRHFLHIRGETRSLAKLPRTSCDVSQLRSKVPDFGSPELATEWQSVQQELQRAQIGDKYGAVNPGDRRAIYQLTRALRARSVLEVGTHLGASTAMFALALRQGGLPSPTIVTVDIRDVNGPRGAWASLGSRPPKTVMQALNCNYVEFVTSPSVPYLSGSSGRFDLIFLDGDHQSTTVYREVPAALKLLNPNGLILLHDFFPNAAPLWSDGAIIAGPWLAIQRFRDEGNRLNVQPLGALQWPTKLDSNVSSLACLIAA